MSDTELVPIPYPLLEKRRALIDELGYLAAFIEQKIGEIQNHVIAINELLKSDLKAVNTIIRRSGTGVEKWFDAVTNALESDDFELPGIVDVYEQMEEAFYTLDDEDAKSTAEELLEQIKGMKDSPIEHLKALIEALESMPDAIEVPVYDE